MHCTCAECGYQWLRGQHGGHSCAENLKKNIVELKLELATLKDKEELILAWESTTPCYKKYITESTYQALRQEYRKWYRPLCASCHHIPVVNLSKPSSAIDFIMPVPVYTESQVIEILEKHNIKVNKYK